MAKPRKGSPVRVKANSGINSAYNGQLGLVYDTVKDGRMLYYRVRLNSQREIVLTENELEILKNTK